MNDKTELFYRKVPIGGGFFKEIFGSRSITYSHKIPNYQIGDIYPVLWETEPCYSGYGIITKCSATLKDDQCYEVVVECDKVTWQPSPPGKLTIFNQEKI